MLDAIVENLPNEYEEENPDVIKFSLIGRPNVGKSSLINAILGEDRVIASPVAGTLVTPLIPTLQIQMVKSLQ